MPIHDLTEHESDVTHLLTLGQTDCEPVVVPAGSVLCREGEAAHMAFWIFDGLVRLMRGEIGRDSQTTGLRQATSTVGFVAAIQRVSYRATAIAVLPTRVLRLSALPLLRQLRPSPDVLTLVADATTREFRADLDDFTRAFLPTLEQRLLAILAHLSGTRAPQTVHLPLAVQRSELVQLVHTSPERLDQLLTVLEQSGGVKHHGDSLVFDCRTLMTSARHEPEPSSGRTLADRGSPVRAWAATDSRVIAAIQLIEARYTNAALNLRLLSKHLDISPWHLSRLFKRATGMGFRQFLNHVRLERARVALQTTDLSIKEIAASVGYNQLSDLTRRFKAMEGISPTAYRLRTDHTNGQVRID